MTPPLHPCSLSITPRKSHCAEVQLWEARSGHIPSPRAVEEGRERCWGKAQAQLRLSFQKAETGAGSLEQRSWGKQGMRRPPHAGILVTLHLLPCVSPHTFISLVALGVVPSLVLTPRSGCRWLLAGLPPSLLLCPSG